MLSGLTRAAALLLLGASLLGCRPSIPKLPPEPRVSAPASPPEELRACWIESARAFGFTASALLIRHPDGLLLVDGGNSSNFREEIRVYPRKDRRWLRLFPGNLRPRVPLAELLREAGVDPASLRWLLPTHAHLDHLGGFLDLPPTPVLMAEPELELVRQGTREVLFEVIPDHARAVEPMAEVLVFDGGPYESFDRHADLFGDRSVVVVPLHGHTPGSVGVFINLPDGRRIFHVGDAVNERSQVAELRGRSPGLRRTDSDRALADSVVAQLHALALALPELELLPAHERRAWREVFGEPGRCSPP